jgi:hypothetical protein
MSERYKWLKRVFPRWFSCRQPIGSTKDCGSFSRNYRTFVAEWRWFIHQPTCTRHCRVAPYAGEVDRCLFGALGPQSFLSHNKDRYKSFMLANEVTGKKRLSSKKSRISVDGLGIDGREVALLHFPAKPWVIPISRHVSGLPTDIVLKGLHYLKHSNFN